MSSKIPDGGSRSGPTHAAKRTKPRPNHRLYISILRDMTPEARLRKAFELSSFTKELFRSGLKRKRPNLDDREFDRLLKRRLDKCHNRNY